VSRKKLSFLNHLDRNPPVGGINSEEGRPATQSLLMIGGPLTHAGTAKKFYATCDQYRMIARLAGGCHQR